MGNNTSLPFKPFFRPDEVADYLNISRALIYRLCENGNINFIRVGKLIRIERAEIVKIIAKTT